MEPNRARRRPARQTARTPLPSGAAAPKRPTACSSTPASPSATPRAIVPYLRDLGITHCYASPYLKARPGSTHGYDITDHRVPQPRDRHARRTTTPGSTPCTRQRHGPDPRHRAQPHGHRRQRERLVERRAGERPGVAATPRYFDIAWHASPRPELHDRVLLPILGDPYGKVLEAGQLRLAYDDGALHASTTSTTASPSRPHSYAQILQPPPRGAGAQPWARTPRPCSSTRAS